MFDLQARISRRSCHRLWPALALAGLAGPGRSSGAGAAAAAAASASARLAIERLRDAVNGRFLIGAAVSARSLADPRLAALIAENFDCLTAENEFKPISVHPREGVYHFDTADRFLAFAQAHGMKLVGHNLCWHSQAPAFLFQAGGKPLERDQALANLRDHINHVAGHFRGKVLGWDVVNEAVSDSGDDPLRATPARRAIGDDYILKAFEFAHAADPDAELYYNDYGNEEPRKLEKTIRLVRAIRASGARLDAVGMQCHMRLSNPAALDQLDHAISAYAAEGVKVALTEVDVDVLPRQNAGAGVEAREQGANPYTNGLPPDVAKAQAQFYARLFQVALKHAPNVVRITFWGTHDGTSWLNNWPVPRRTNYPLPWDRNLEPKPALNAILHVLAET